MPETNQQTQQAKPVLSGQDKAYRIGGSAIGGIVVGGALGSMAGPVGTTVGAIAGGALGLVVSISDTRKSGNK